MSTPSLDENEVELKVFSKILSFVNEYKNVFSEPSIDKYYRLLKKTKISNTNGIKKHIEIFKTWLELNHQAILTQNVSEIHEPISISEQVYLPIRQSLEKTDKETRQSIFKHLQVISYRISPNEELKKVLAQSQSSSTPSTNTSTKTNLNSSEEEKGQEEEFLNKFMGKIENSFSDKEFNDPMTATMSMLQSGVFTELISDMNQGMNNGQLDMNRLLGSVQGMLGSLTGGDPSAVLGGMPGMPDLGGMMQMMSSMMGGMNLNPSSSTNNNNGSSVPSLEHNEEF